MEFYGIVSREYQFEIMTIDNLSVLVDDSCEKGLAYES
jgi:hypothetical protein